MSIAKIILVLTLVAAAPAYATFVFATGAGPLPASAQDLTGLFPTEIQGSLTDTPDGANASVFMIDILDPLLFFADMESIAFGMGDTELFLFDVNGVGVYANDDKAAAS